MVKGVSIKFKSYQETVPKLLEVTKFENTLKQHQRIILKPTLNVFGNNTPIDFVEAVVQFCLTHKNPETKIMIAEGSEGASTVDLFEEAGYKRLAEQYGVGLIDLNTAEVEEIKDGKFMVFDAIKYPKILTQGLLVSLPKLGAHPELEMSGALANMLGAYPAHQYQGFFSKTKNKLRAEPIKYAIHDILRCKMPELAIVDASEFGLVYTGNPLEIDKQAARHIKSDWKAISHLRLVEDSFARDFEAQARKAEKQAQAAAANTKL